jgi:hypothetical protein
MGLMQGDPLTPLLFNSAGDYTIESVQENIEGLEMNWTHQLHLKILIELSETYISYSYTEKFKCAKLNKRTRAPHLQFC